MNRAIILAATVALLLALAGCGGGGSDATGEWSPNNSSPERSKGEYVTKADRICSAMAVDARRMGDRFRALTGVKVRAITLTTQRLVKPALPVIERSARRLRALEPEAASIDFESYVSLYDPIASIVRERIRAGEAGDSNGAHKLELILLDLSDIQQRLAREAGLQACDVDFIQVFSSGRLRP